MPPPDPHPARPAVEPHEKQLARIERLADFGGQMASALRQEFSYFWDRPDRRQEVPEATAFCTKVENLRQLTSRYLREVARSRHLPPMHALAVAKTLDLGELLDAGSGLEATARVLRERGRERGWGTGRLAGTTRAGALPWADADGWAKLFQSAGVAKQAPPVAPTSKGGWLTGRLQGLAEKLAITPVKEAGPPPPVPPGVRRLQAFEGAMGLIREVLIETSPRMAALRAALEDPAAPSARVSAELKPLVAPAAAAIARDPALKRAVQVAAGQWERTATLAREFEAGLVAARKVPPEQVGEVLRPFQVDKLKGLLLPLTNLHLTFRTVPPVAALFPPPAERRLEGSLPVDDSQGREIEEDPETNAAEAVEAEAPAPRLSPDEQSRRRLGLIMNYLNDPDSVPELADETLLYRLVAEEHAYQDDRVVDLGMKLRLLPQATNAEERAARQAQAQELGDALDEARQNKGHLQELLSMVAGRDEGEPDG